MDNRTADDRIADLHIHSRHSHDSLLSPRVIVKRAQAAGLTCIAITDHGTIRGGIEARQYATASSPEIIVGTEIRTDCGDIIGLGLSAEIRSTAWKDVIREIRDTGGIVILPHPCRDHMNVEEIAPLVDYVEGWNARSTPEQNERARDLARRHAKPVVAGSDAHLASEIGSVKARISRDSFTCRELIAARYASQAEIRKSQVGSCIRQGKWGTLIRGGFSAVAGKFRR